MSFPFVCPVALDHSMIFENTLLACATPYTPKNARNRSKHPTRSCSETKKLTIINSRLDGLQSVNGSERGPTTHVRGPKEA